MLFERSIFSWLEFHEDYGVRPPHFMTDAIWWATGFHTDGCMSYRQVSSRRWSNHNHASDQGPVGHHLAEDFIEDKYSAGHQKDPKRLNINISQTTTWKVVHQHHPMGVLAGFPNRTPKQDGAAIFTDASLNGPHLHPTKAKCIKTPSLVSWLQLPRFH